MTFLQAKNKFPTYGASAGAMLNFVIERAFQLGKWDGTIAKVRVAVYDFDDAGVTRRQFTLPREAKTALGVRFEAQDSVGHTSARSIRNQWYSWLEGRCTGDWNCGIEDLGDSWQTFRDVPANARLRIRTDYAETGTFSIRGISSTGATIYTGAPPSVIEGTTLNLATNPATTTETFLAGAPVQIVKPATQGPVRLYSYDGTTETLLATYAPGETVPAYRRYLLPTGSTNSWVLVKAKRRFVELIADNDLVFPDNLPALDYGMKAKNQDDKLGPDKAGPYWEDFYACLNAGLREEQGNAPLVMKLRSGEGFGSIRQGY